MKIDLEKFKYTLPYASELYGIYQPLIGWRSQRVQRRIAKAFPRQVYAVLQALGNQYQPLVELGDHTAQETGFNSLGIAQKLTSQVQLPSIFGRSILAKIISTQIEEQGQDDPDVWARLTSAGFIKDVLSSMRNAIDEQYRTALQLQGDPRNGEIQRITAERILNQESIVAGILTDLNAQMDGGQLKALFSLSSQEKVLPLAFDMLNSLDPRKVALDRGTISPIGIIHLFRQYFFEFDTFLGPPVQHIWLSPGGTVELVEVSTRRTFVEKTAEQFVESIEKRESSLSLQDEISDAVKQENASSTKFGVSLNTSHSFKGGAIYTGQVSSSASFDMDNSQKESREQTHKQMRQQTEKISSELKQSFKSTFRTITETTDTTSRRYVIENKSSDKLMNYEMRRKMRQVGVQVQDYGTQLCWQTYVDKENLGDQLGLAQLVHVAAQPDLSTNKDPELLPLPAQFVSGAPIVFDVNFNSGNTEYGKGAEQPFPSLSMPVLPPLHYVFKGYEVKVLAGEGFRFAAYALNSGGSRVLETAGIDERKDVKQLIPVLTLHDGFEDEEFRSFKVQYIIHYEATLDANKAVNEENDKRRDKATESARQKYTAELFQAARERIKLASNVNKRSSEVLREEERIIVYRALIKQLLKDLNIPTATQQTHHLLAELIQSMFDVDKMLYFVAPDWWQPRSLGGAAPQHLGLDDLEQAASKSIGEANISNWGGNLKSRPSNYYITESSRPAPLGSSLGWILQLDGDNLRNAFLNSPWVKAIVPIRLGHEWKAMEWLSAAHVEGSDGLIGAFYDAPDAEKQKMLDALKAHDWHPLKPAEREALKQRYATLTIIAFELIDALRYLIISIQAKHEISKLVKPDADEPQFNYLPTDAVFERGFDPLVGGFNASPKKGEPFDIFDQWIEIVPTDQIVPVEVEYDPKTGMQK